MDLCLSWVSGSVAVCDKATAHSDWLHQHGIRAVLCLDAGDGDPSAYSNGLSGVQCCPVGPQDGAGSAAYDAAVRALGRLLELFDRVAIFGGSQGKAAAVSESLRTGLVRTAPALRTKPLPTRTWPVWTEFAVS